MAAEFDWIGLTDVGANVNVEGKQGALLTVSLDIGEELFWPEVSMSVAVDRRENITWSELEEQARIAAIEQLRVALATLENGTVAELRERAEAKRQARQRENDERLERDLSKVFGRGRDI